VSPDSFKKYPVACLSDACELPKALAEERTAEGARPYKDEKGVQAEL
jgi:hypothetical protein